MQEEKLQITLKSRIDHWNFIDDDKIMFWREEHIGRELGRKSGVGEIERVEREIERETHIQTLLNVAFSSFERESNWTFFGYSECNFS